MLNREQIQEWEYDFTPNPDTSCCPNCGQMFITEAGVPKDIWDGEEAVTFLWCSTNCHHEYYLARLREQL